MSTADRLRLEGYSQGLQQGQANTVLRWLQYRFGPVPAELTERVAKAGRADLDTWTDRVLDAKSLADVFAT